MITMPRLVGQRTSRANRRCRFGRIVSSAAITAKIATKAPIRQASSVLVPIISSSTERYTDLGLADNCSPTTPTITSTRLIRRIAVTGSLKYTNPITAISAVPAPDQMA